MIRRDSGVSNVYTFLHAYFEGVELYDASRYVNFTKEGIDEAFLIDK